jgi:rfaE bifunctional protein kinase chain/domain
MKKERVESLLKAMCGKKVLIIGDVMLDEYLWGQVERISPEAPVPVVKVEKQTFALGGASNVAANALSLGADPLLVGIVGDDEAGRTVRSLLKKTGMNESGIFTEKSRRTIVKKRVVAHHQQVVRVDFEETASVESRAEYEILRFLGQNCKAIAGIIIEDYNKGLLTKRIIRGILSLAQRRKIPVTVDPKFEHFFDYEGVTLFKPNVRELERVVGQSLKEESKILSTVRKLLKRMNIRAMLLTMGEKGMLLVEKGEKPYHIEPHALDVFDVTGAGDTVITAATLALISGATLKEAARFASMAAAIEVTKLGAAVVLPAELIKFSEQCNQGSSRSDPKPSAR